MGLFSKKKTYVESFAMPLVEDTPNFVQQSVLTSIRAERSIAEDLIANTINGLGSNLARYYRYGQNEYYYGLPSGSNNRNNISPETVRIILANITGSGVYVDYAVYGTPDGQYYAEDHLENVRNWNRTTDLVSSPPFGSGGLPVYLDNAVFTSATNVRITYRFGTTPNIQYRTENLTVAPVQLRDEYYHTSYFLVDSAGNVGTTRFWWFYREADDTYETLKIDKTDAIPYYPVVPLRHNNVDMTIDDGSARYITSKQLLNRIKMNITELGVGVNSNPDIGDVDHAYIMMGISTQTTSQAGMRYLFEYFKYLETGSVFEKEDYDRWLALTTDEQEQTTPSMNKVSIRESGISYDVELGYLYITSTVSAGSIGKLNHTDTRTTIRSPNEQASFAFETSEFRVRKQISANAYETITVVGLKHINNIYRSYTVDTTLEDAYNAANTPDTFTDGMQIPLNEVVVRSMPLTVRTELAYDAFKIVFNCVTVQKLKWYQTDLFKFVAIIVSIALTVFSLGSLSSSLLWAAQLVGTSSLIVGAVVLGVLSIGIKYGVAYLVDAIGIKSGFILAIVAVAASYFSSGYISPQTLSLVQSGFQSGVDLAIDWEMDDVIKDLEALQREITEANEELEELYDGLGTKNLVDPFLIANSSNGLASPDETPEQYYNTRIHFGNMASVAPLAVTNYVDNELKLEGLTVHYGIKV